LALAFEYVNSIDFEMVIEKITRPDENVAKLWSKEAAEAAIHYYKNFLKLLRKYGNQHDYLPPSVEIDEIWHHHILDTRKYQIDCRKIFGRLLHHYPYFGMRYEGDDITLANAFEVTQQLHILEFGEPIPGFEFELASVVPAEYAPISA
jgi:hypothetical protein